MADLKTAIENLYLTFSQYTTLGMHYCDCGCIKEEEVKKLHSKSLRELKTDDVVYYQGSAMYTWGDVEHYKHFLPRIFELYVAKRKSLIELYEIADKLEHAVWAEWPANEVQAIKDFVLADWIDFINNSDAEVSDSDLKNYSRFFNIAQLLKLWDIAQSGKGLKNFVLFFYYYGNQILDKGLKLNEKQYEKGLKDLIYTTNLTDRLQEEFFRYETTDKEYAERVSVVLLMIEQQLKLHQ